MMMNGGTSTTSNGNGRHHNKEIVIIVDPYSTGCCIAQEMIKRGFQVLALWTKEFAPAMKTHVPLSCENLTYLAEVDEVGTLEETEESVKRAAATKDCTIVACLAGGEAGVDLADALSEKLGVRTNGTQISNRRDKKIQQELIKEMGLRSVRQAAGTKLEQVEDFLTTEQYPIVLKPTESAGSDGVKLCHTYEEAKEHFQVLMKSQMVNGGECPAVLCQEFLQGKEYVVDHVSRDGVHKTAMMWVYDKRPVNGAAFVYFGCLPVDLESPEAKAVIPYVRTVLDALGMKNGPSHGEVIITADGPCLVEMNCRARGGDGNWRSLARALTGGYSQVEMTVDSYLDPAHFDLMPDMPPSPFKASGQEVILVSFSNGTVKETPGYSIIRKLPSFVFLETGVKVGTYVDYTVDLFTGIGSVILMHEDEKVLARDVEFIRTMEEINGLFEYEVKKENLNRPRGDSIYMNPAYYAATAAGGPETADGPPKLDRTFSMMRQEEVFDRPLMKRMTTMDASKEAVIIVDPYSTGCLVAEEILNRGYKIIALWTDGFSEVMKTHVPMSVRNLTYYAEVTEVKASLVDTETAVKKAAGSFRIVACLAGGEAGVDLADALSEQLGVRTNGTQISNRRDKKIQQELIKADGLRSVRQAGGTKFAEVEEFLLTEAYPVVLKPTESAGSDGVKLCHTFEEAKEHFQVLMTSQMVNGGECPAVLCQEFLKGKEYVVDHVSRDGEHKTAMMWVYDKRSVNGAAFVYFGCLPVDLDSVEARLIIPYVRRVLDSLGMKNGPSHGEVIMTADGPCLVEMNCRARGGDGNWRSLARALTGGYSQVEATADSYLDPQQFAVMPDKPPCPFKASGQEVILVSFSRGTVKDMPGFEVIKQLPSFVYLETGVRKGSKVDYTIDLFTGIGSVILMHKDDSVVEKDIELIRQMERENTLFVYEASVELLSRPSMLDLANLSLTDVTKASAGNKSISYDRMELY
jgi:biotin carboxylase